jgi:hypothetical protein
MPFSMIPAGCAKQLLDPLRLARQAPAVEGLLGRHAVAHVAVAVHRAVLLHELAEARAGVVSAVGHGVAPPCERQA